MNRDRITRKRVHGENIELLALLPFEAQAGVAHHNLFVRHGVRIEAKPVLRDARDEGVDLIDTQITARPPIIREPPPPQTDAAEARGAALMNGTNRASHTGGF